MVETLREDIPDSAIDLQTENKTYPGKQAASSILLVRTYKQWLAIAIYFRVTSIFAWVPSWHHTLSMKISDQQHFESSGGHYFLDHFN